MAAIGNWVKAKLKINDEITKNIELLPNTEYTQTVNKIGNLIIGSIVSSNYTTYPLTADIEYADTEDMVLQLKELIIKHPSEVGPFANQARQCGWSTPYQVTSAYSSGEIAPILPVYIKDDRDKLFTPLNIIQKYWTDMPSEGSRGLAFQISIIRSIYNTVIL